MSTLVSMMMLCCVPLAVHASGQDILAQLNHPDPAIRVASTATLLQDPQLTLDHIEQLLKKATHPEQRHRLLNVARHHLFRQLIKPFYQSSRKGSLGVRLYEPAPGLGSAPENALEIDPGGGGGVMIGRTLPGFPAYAYLQKGDRIVAINEVPLPHRRDGISMTKACIGMITRHAPGQKIQLTIIRDHKPLSVTFAAAPFEALNDLYEHNQTRTGQRIIPTAKALEQWNKQLAQWQKILHPQNP